MILLVNPRATKPQNRRMPLSLLHLGASLPSDVSWEILDGNLPTSDLETEVAAHIDGQRATADPVHLVAVTVMPGPQLVSAVHLSRWIKARYPELPVVWGGYFPTLYPLPAASDPSVDWVVRGQGERTLGELIEVLDGRREAGSVAGLCYRDGEKVVLGSERQWEGPDAFPAPPYDRLAIEDYLLPSAIGRRTGVYQSSIGCPYTCSFCGVIGAWGSRERFEDPRRVEANLGSLQRRHGLDSVYFYDNNFFLAEERARELSGRLEPLDLSWWCEARIDVMLRFRQSTWERIRRAGLKMAFFGAESGSDDSLRRMDKQLTVEQIEELAARTREHGIVPEFSFCLGDPEDPEEDVLRTMALIRRLKGINPRSEIVLYYYTPTPQRRQSYYSHLSQATPTPETLDEWIEPQWIAWACHSDPDLPWLSPALKRRVENFQLVLSGRFPSVHGSRGRTGRLARAAAWWSWWRGDFSDTRLLRLLRSWLAKPDPRAYGHLRPAEEEVV